MPCKPTNLPFASISYGSNNCGSPSLLGAVKATAAAATAVAAAGGGREVGGEAAIITVSSLLKHLGHGATSSAHPSSSPSSPPPPPLGTKAPVGGLRGVQGEKRGWGGERKEARRVLIGVLTFDSVLEGVLAVSSLFLKDETGEVLDLYFLLH